MKQYLIGVDGGGTKTVAAIADLGGRILKTAEAGPSSPVNVGMEIACRNISAALKRILRPGQIVFTFIGLAAVEEEPRFKKMVRKELLKQDSIKAIFQGRVEINSDQLAAFVAGTDSREGILQISGTGCVARGWARGREAAASGWHWLGDEGSAFWIGQQSFQAIFKDLDGRGPKTMMTDLTFSEWKVKTKQALLKKVYAEPTKFMPLLSIICGRAGSKQDRVAKEILVGAGGELALASGTIIKKFKWQNKKFPLVMVGGTFKSEIVLKTFQKQIRRLAPKTDFILTKKQPVEGAIKLAIRRLKRF